MRCQTWASASCATVWRSLGTASFTRTLPYHPVVSPPPPLQIHSQPHVAFEVRLQRERVAGASGPYREFFADVARELMLVPVAAPTTAASTTDGNPVPSSALTLPPTPSTARLPLFCPSCNQSETIGDGRDMYVVTPSSLTPEHLRMYRMLGRLIGCAMRTGVRLSVAVAPLFWKALVGEPIGLADLELVDAMLVKKKIRVLRECSEKVGNCGRRHVESRWG